MPKNRLMSVDEVRGVWVVMPTPAKPGAEDWRARDTVDLDETARVVNALIDAGADAVVSLGTLGECATLTWDEKKAFMATLVDAARGRVPVFVGTTTLNTRDTVDQTRYAADLGVNGTMLGLPMWCPVSVPAAVQYYRDVAQACPDIAICAYANPDAFRFGYPAAFWAQLSEIPQVITAKYLGLGTLLRDITASRRRIRFLSTNGDYYGAARMDPEFCTAFWTSGAVCGPLVSTVLRDEVARAKSTGDWSRAKMLTDATAVASAPFRPSAAEFAMHNIGLEKGRTNAAGWMKAGPCRPPYHMAPPELLEGAQKAGRNWAALHATLASGRFFETA